MIHFCDVDENGQRRTREEAEARARRMFHFRDNGGATTICSLFGVDCTPANEIRCEALYRSEHVDRERDGGVRGPRDW